MRYLGEVLALVTALGWATSSIMFEKSSKRATGLSSNLLKLSFLLLILMGITSMTRGLPLPYDATPKMKFYLSMSGIIGLFIGDFFLFKAYATIGARLCLLFSTLGPIMVSLLGFLFLGESLRFIQIAAILIICTGIFIVVSKPKKEVQEKEKEINTQGIIYAFIAIFTDALGIILTKIGSQGYNSFAATELRTIPALLAFILFITYKKKWGNIVETVKDFTSVKYIFFGTIFATAGICSLVEAMKYGKIGIVSTIASTSPILIIPISVFILKERVKRIELIGAVVSCFGVSLLFL